MLMLPVVLVEVFKYGEVREKVYNKNTFPTDTEKDVGAIQYVVNRLGWKLNINQ